MISAMNHALDHIRDHQARLKPGVTIRELTHGGHQLAPEYWRQKYSCKMHGVGLCDEWPFVPYPDGWTDGAFEVALEPGMVLCTEALVSPEGGHFSIKLEDQVLITETGCENLTTPTRSTQPSLARPDPFSVPKYPRRRPPALRGRRRAFMAPSPPDRGRRRGKVRNRCGSPAMKRRRMPARISAQWSEGGQTEQ